MAARGSYSNPADKSCFNPCMACFRCKDRYTGTINKCTNCSGHVDVRGDIEPHNEDWCNCQNGVLRWVSRKGTIIIKKYPKNPFEGDIKVHTETKDEMDWKRYLAEQREKLDDPDWDPVNLYDSSKGERPRVY
jgi:hypothetical protein